MLFYAYVRMYIVAVNLLGLQRHIFACMKFVIGGRMMEDYHKMFYFRVLSILRISDKKRNERQLERQTKY